MKHEFLDHYSCIKSPIQGLNAIAKIICFFAFLLAVVTTPNYRYLDYAIYGPILIIIFFLSHLPLRLILGRIAILLPFTIVIGLSIPFITPGKILFSFNFFFDFHVTLEGLLFLSSVILKAIFAISIMTILSSSTPFSEIIFGLQKLHVPQIITSLLGFIYRYIFLFTDEIHRLNMGRNARTISKNWGLSIKSYSWLISSLLIRSFERSERIYQAMCARGFNGKFKIINTISVSIVDIVIIALCLLSIITIKLVGVFYG